jgi:signal transduction histidine kinase
LSELKGLSCREAFHADDRACPHEEVLAAGAAAAGEVRISGRILLVRVEPLLDAVNQTYGFVRVMQDVTSQRRAHDQLLVAERFATLGQLLAAIAHDVGTPLNVISGYAEYLLMRSEPSGQSSKELSAILDQTRRIASMFNQALDLARPPQGRAEAIDIRALLADSVECARRM